MLARSWIPLVVVLGAVAAPCAAQTASFDARRAEPAYSSGNISQTPEMWFYEQERSRYEDPALAVRRRAELRGAQRAERLAALKWYGLSNSRPTYSPIPFMNSLSPYWGSNTYDPHRWRTAESAVILTQPASSRY